MHYYYYYYYYGTLNTFSFHPVIHRGSHHRYSSCVVSCPCLIFIFHLMRFPMKLLINLLPYGHRRMFYVRIGLYGHRQLKILLQCLVTYVLCWVYYACNAILLWILWLLISVNSDFGLYAQHHSLLLTTNITSRNVNKILSYQSHDDDKTSKYFKLAHDRWLSHNMWWNNQLSIRPIDKTRNAP